MVFKVYSDGSGMTGGPAGIGFVAYADGELLLKGNRAVARATNHQAELRAAVFALDSIPEGQDVELLSDSKYVVDGYNTYPPKWRERGWPDSGVGSVVNRALWKQLIVAAKRHRDVRFRWTKGHDGTEGNEHAHRLAELLGKLAQYAILAFVILIALDEGPLGLTGLLDAAGGRGPRVARRRPAGGASNAPPLTSRTQARKLPKSRGAMRTGDSCRGRTGTPPATCYRFARDGAASSLQVE